MDPNRWRRIEQLYHDAVARPAAERAAFLADACRGDEALRRDVQALLDVPTAAHQPLSAPALALASPDLAGPLLPSDAAPLTGQPLGSYRLQERIGAGGMGEVYRARDLRLGRDVALKILPAAFTDDPDRVARFEREARILAALNHPHIAAIYGVEKQGSLHALVLELVDGATLADRLARGPMAVDEALDVASQIAEALEAAHDKGIIHRDLKPANIKIAPAGTVKVLDFGLAKVADRSSAASQAPTVTVGGTRDGAILGTAVYMSPEQARGQAIDKRTDIWAFGCVLYELLTGRRAFSGETISDTIVAILDREPDWTLLPAATPEAITHLLVRMLAKDVQRRLRDIGDARLEIDAARSISSEARAPVARPPRTMAFV